MNSSGIEIEHKYLIEYPDRNELLKLDGASSAILSQTYLKTDSSCTERVRRWEQNGKVRYYHTVKRRVSDLTHLEDEQQIEEGEYLDLLTRRDESAQTIEKERIMIPFAGHTVEVDIYPFWQDRAVAEVEVSGEEEEVLLPDTIKVIREVSDDRRYKNARLAFDHSFPLD